MGEIRLNGVSYGSGSESGGHIIQNAAGTDLAQESKLQFGGMLKTTDDATNGVTKVSDLAEEVEWSVWNAMTESERTAYSAGKKIDIINVPSVSGSIPVELMKKLWTNSNPTVAFAEQTITLSSDDYDSLLILTNYSTNVFLEFSNIIEKTSSGCVIEYSFAYNNIERQLTREIRKVSDTSISIKNNSYFKGSQTDVENDYLIPLAIYGIKSSVNVDMSALVANVSTSASKCMLSDNETSVEDAIDTLGTTGNQRTFQEGLTEYSSSSNQYVTPCDGYIWIRNGSGQTAILLAYNGNVAIGGHQGDASLWVKKGTRVYVDGTCTAAYFRAFN